MDREMNGAESLADTLLAGGVTVCFANPGTSEMQFVAALDARPEMRCILCLFEGGATGAADGYFRMTGEVAVTLLHLAPGFGNGLANLHNARKAQSGVLTVMGDHASYHLKYEAPLKGDTMGVAQTVSHWVRVSQDATQVARDGAEGLRAARSKNGQIATLILPADTAWNAGGMVEPAQPVPVPRRPPERDIAAAARGLREPGAALLVGGSALHGAHSLLAARIAASSGCRLLSQYFVPRQRRGAGAVRIERLSYRIDSNLTLLAQVNTLVVCGTTRPAGFFAYPGRPSLPENPDGRVIELCGMDEDIAGTLRRLAEQLGIRAENELPTEAFVALNLPEVPSGPLTVERLGQAIAALMPENAVVVDEGISNTPALLAATETARGHDWLSTTGGAIGAGLPMAVGAAVACPDRKVVVLQADGSGMYTLQSLWTMARERLDVCVVLLANRGYRILRLEMAAVGAVPGRNAAAMFDVEDPELDWVALAKGHGVQAVRVTDTDQFVAAFGGAMARRGPFLIEVVL
jgi:acetolactate synthase-1/2/3 large subunit